MSRPTENTVAVLLIVLLSGALIADQTERIYAVRFLGVFWAIIGFIALSVALIRWGLYGLLTLIGVRLVRIGQSRGQKLASKRAAQQRARVSELQSLAIVEMEK